MKRKTKAIKWNICSECGQPLLPDGAVKRPNEFDHAVGCSLAGYGRLNRFTRQELLLLYRGLSELLPGESIDDPDYIQHEYLLAEFSQAIKAEI